MAARQELGAAADELDACSAGIGNAPLQQGRLQAASAELGDRSSRCAVADPVLHIQNGSRCWLAPDTAEIEGPARLVDPAARIRREAGDIGHTPSGGMRVE